MAQRSRTLQATYLSRLALLALMALLAVLLGLLLQAPVESGTPSPGPVPLEEILLEAEQQSPQILRQLLLALGMTLLCTVIHLVISAMVAAGLHNEGLMRWASRTSSRQLLLIAGTALATFLAMLIEILTWAVLFLRLGAVANVEQALYFSSVTFASLGYGDITVALPFRLLASLEALVGILMAGWSTALLLAVVQKCLGLRNHRKASGSDSSITSAP